VICLWQEAKTQRLRAMRARPLGKTAGAVVLFAVLSLPLSSLARADSSNLLLNGSFQSGTSGWKATMQPSRSQATAPASFATKLSGSTNRAIELHGQLKRDWPVLRRRLTRSSTLVERLPLAPSRLGRNPISSITSIRSTIRTLLRVESVG